MTRAFAACLAALATINGLRGAEEPPAARDAAQVKPLAVGDSVPPLRLKNAEGKEFDLNAALAERPTTLVFYRGGWCPFCTRHLQELGQIQSRLKAAGVQVFAISPDSPGNVAKSDAKLDVPYTLLSDADARATRAFGLGFTVDAATREKYRGFGIDLQQASGHDHNVLPVPAVYLVNTDGTVIYRHYDPDYRQRLSAQELMEAVQKNLSAN